MFSYTSKVDKYCTLSDFILIFWTVLTIKLKALFKESIKKNLKNTSHIEVKVTTFKSNEYI